MAISEYLCQVQNPDGTLVIEWERVPLTVAQASLWATQQQAIGKPGERIVLVAQAAGGTVPQGWPQPISVIPTAANQLDAEQVQDIVGAMLKAGTGIQFTYDDAGNVATITNTAPESTPANNGGTTSGATGIIAFNSNGPSYLTGKTYVTFAAGAAIDTTGGAWALTANAGEFQCTKEASYRVEFVTVGTNQDVMRSAQIEGFSSIIGAGATVRQLGDTGGNGRNITTAICTRQFVVGDKIRFAVNVSEAGNWAHFTKATFVRI